MRAVPAGKERSGFHSRGNSRGHRHHWGARQFAAPGPGPWQRNGQSRQSPGELYGIGLALDMYATDNAGKFPPVRVNCNTDLRLDWCELPVELANQRYLPHGPAGLDADLQDVFNPGHTYKYAAPGPQLLNGSPTANYELWEPTNLATMSGGGQYFTNPKLSPIRWVVWSLGPQPDSPKAQDTYAPLNRESWYTQAGDTGVIARYANHDGTQFSTH